MTLPVTIRKVDVIWANPRPAAPDNILGLLSEKPRGNFWEVGALDLIWNIEKALRSLPLRSRRALHIYLTRHRAERFVTLCAGTDSPTQVLIAFEVAVRRVFDIDLQFAHVLRVEKDRSKRRFMVDMSKGTRFEKTPLAEDVLELSNDSVEDTLTGKQIDVSPFDFNFVGVPCLDASRRNPNAAGSASRTCVSNNAMRTGSVMNGVVDFYKAHGVEHGMKAGILEEVLGFADPPMENDSLPLWLQNRSNLDLAVNMFDQIELWSIATVIEPSMHWGAQISRRRLYVPHIVQSCLAAMPEVQREEIYLETLGYITGAFEAVSLEDLLLPEDC